MILRGGELDATRVVSAAMLARATRQAVDNHPDLNSGWGLGFEVRAQRGRRVAGHSGGLTGAATRIELFPDDGLGVVVLTNGGDPAFVARVTAHLCDRLFGLDPEFAPGSPRGIDAGREDAWRAITTRAVGSYRLVDTLPPGPITMLARLIAKAKVSHVADCVLAIEGVPGGVMFLYPDGPAGRYRIAGPMLCGDRAVLEAKANGMHFWASIIHMQHT
jgi:hypothetical protein